MPKRNSITEVPTDLFEEWFRIGRMVLLDATELYTTQGAAEELKVTDRNVRDLCYRGTIKARRKGHMWLIPRSELADYIRRRRKRLLPF